MLKILVPPAYEVEYDLPLATPELQKRLDEMYDSGRLPELIDPTAMLSSLRGGFPSPMTQPMPRPRLGVIHWPVVGAARYAVGCMVLDEYRLGQLRAALEDAQGSGVNDNKIIFRFRDDPEDGGGVTVDTGVILNDVYMRLLVTRPLVRTGEDPLTATDEGEQDAWVAIFVDDRYAALTSSVTSATTSSWDGLLSGLGGYTGVGGSDAVDADYGATPNLRRWSGQTPEITSASSAVLSGYAATGRSSAWLLDVAAASVGSRIVCIPHPNVLRRYVQRPTTARSDLLDAAHDAAVAEGRLIGGGPITDEDRTYLLPNTYRVMFSSPDQKPVPVLVNTAETRWYGIDYTVTAWADAPPVVGSSAMSAYAAQLAADIEAWKSVQYDTLYAGYVPAPLSGFLWAIEWTHTSSEYTTRFFRAPDRWDVLTAPDLGTVGAMWSQWKQPALLATTGNLASLSTSLAVGATIDGVVLVSGYRVLVKDQTTDSENGIYLVTSYGPIRAEDSDEGNYKLAGATVAVQMGTANKDTVWLCKVDPPFGSPGGANPRTWVKLGPVSGFTGTLETGETVVDGVITAGGTGIIDGGTW